MVQVCRILGVYLVFSTQSEHPKARYMGLCWLQAITLLQRRSALGVPKNHRRKLLYLSARCSEWTHFHFPQCTFCKHADACLACVFIWKAEPPLLHLPFLHTPFLMATHTPEDRIYVLLTSTFAVFHAESSILESFLDVIERLVEIIIGLFLVWP